MPTKPSRKGQMPAVYWDSCVFIDWIAKAPRRLDAIEDLVKMAQDQRLRIVTSTITEGEVIQWPGDEPCEESNQKIAEFFKNPWISRRNPDPRVMDVVRKIRLVNRLKLPDAIHVATALVHEVIALHTFDRDHLIKRSGKFTHDGKFFLKIIEPQDPSPPSYPLFSDDPEG